MRTPVGAIQSGCRVLQQQHAEGSYHEMSATLDHMFAALETGLNFLEAILLSARLLEGQAVTSEEEHMDVSAVLHNAISCCKLCCSPRKDIEVSATVAGDIAEGIISDRNFVQRSLMNLLNNACQHTDVGQITLVTELTEERRFLKFSVWDTGRGHDPVNSEIWVTRSGLVPGEAEMCT